MLSEISLLIEKNELSTLKDKILSQKGCDKNQDLITIMGIINTLMGNFQGAVNSFSNLVDKRYLEFIVNTVNSEYIPLYNQMIKELEKDNPRVEELFVELERILPNTELYEMMTLYYLEKPEIEKARLALFKGLEIDSSSSNLLKLKKHFKTPQTNNSMKKNLTIAALIIGVIIIGITLNYNNKIKQEKLGYAHTIREQEKGIANLEEQLIKLKKIEFVKEKQVIVEVPNTIGSSFVDDFTQREFYRKAQTYRRKKSLEKAIEYYSLVVNSNEESYLKRESLFWLGRSYEDFDNIPKAIDSFKEYMERYSDEEIYLQEVSLRLKRLEKKER